MIDKYRPLLKDRQFLNITEEGIRNNHGSFEAALNDLNACLRCNGKCRSTLNHRCYNPKHETIAECKDSCFGNVKACLEINNEHSYIEKVPMFSVFKCESITDRKKMLFKEKAYNKGGTL